MLSIAQVLRAQAPVIRGMGEVALSGLVRRGGKARVPGPEIRVTLPPRDEALVSAYAESVGVDSGVYPDVVPPHMFPQWAFALTGKLLGELPYPLLSAMNGGCRMEQRALIPRGEPLEVRAQLTSVDDDGKRAILTERFVTGTASVPDALSCEVRVFVPLARGKRTKGTKDAEKKARPVIAEGTEQLASLSLGAGAGLSYARVTGDFNPIHWVPAWARMSGFRSVILHGFGTFARAFEALRVGRAEGDPLRVRSLDVRFTRPLVLPASTGVWASADGRVWVGAGPGATPYCEGTFEIG